MQRFYPLGTCRGIMAGALSAGKSRPLLWVLLGGEADRARIASEFAVRDRST